MATYSDVQKTVKERYGKTVKTCWIAHVKELNGLSVGQAWNRESDARTNPCPEWARPMIEDAMRRLEMLGSL